MLIDVKEVEHCKVNVHVEVDSTVIKDKKNDVLKKFRKMRVKGFRAGKAPNDVLNHVFKNEISNELLNEMALYSFESFIHEKGVRPFGQPTVTSTNLSSEKFECDFSINLIPSVELAEYKGFVIPKMENSTKPNDIVEQMLQNARSQYGDQVDFSTDDFVQAGDTLVIDYEGTQDGVPVENLQVSNETLTLGKSHIADFESNLLGMKVGEVRTFNVVIPENSLPTFAGKTIEFKVKLNSAKRIQPCPLDDTLAVKMGKSTLEEVRSGFEADAAARVQQVEKRHVTDQIAKRLIANHVFVVPQWIITPEAQMLAKNAGNDWDKLADLDKESYLKRAEDSIRLSLILEQVRRIEIEAQLTTEELRASMLAAFANFSTGGSLAAAEGMIANLEKSGYINALYGKLNDENTLDFISKSCTLTE